MALANKSQIWLQDLFQHPTAFPSHNSRLQNILFHLNYAGLASESRMHVVNYRTSPFRFGRASWNGYSFHPILRILSLSDNQNLSDLVLGKWINQECAESIWAMCKAVKKQPSALLGLLIDIATLETQVAKVWPVTMTIILKCVESAVAISVDAGISNLLNPLAHILQQLRVAMVKYGRDKPEKRRLVAAEAGRIINLIEAKANGHPLC